ncbi:MAG: hypothetical protein II707_09165 [Spirochaetales bacterium]|nr:hypothetical protein [Spirochaetales bacterium]
MTLLSNLNQEEIQHLYELFFGPILVKHQNFSYLDNIMTLLSKPNSIKTYLDKLNTQEKKVLEYLSRFRMISESFLKEKLNIIIDMPLFLIEKIISVLIAKNFIFRRGDCLVIPQIFYPNEPPNIEQEQFPAVEEEYFPKAMTDVHNMISFFICQGFSFSNQLFLYKKDFQLTEQMFANYAVLHGNEYNFVSYFFANAFISDGPSLNLYQLRSFFAMNILDRAMYILEIISPNMFSVIKHFNNTGKSIKISRDNLFYLWEQTLLKQEFDYAPLRVTFDEIMGYLINMEIVKQDGDGYIIRCWTKSAPDRPSDLKISTNFNLFMNASTLRSDQYVPTLFADMKNYNSIVEYEITENSVRRGVINGYTYDSFCKFLKDNNVVLPQNVDSTISQWFEKHGSYYYTTGTVFFCNTKAKAKIIQNLIENGYVKAYELKKDEVYIIPEEDREDFFRFLDKSGINYFNKEPNIRKAIKRNKVLDVESVIAGEEDN